ncbi:hypothetical protein BD626DRAFT_521437 [Schizophyllum amplum]|uniref:Uncharacterized protein n=1 Tax=Schizophyllum amplum TaxID=97359 RepID=A0A550BTR4_9AGAR|nr:hypothetical protein BD626DRAFT_521437 [Auriculariopsis ampla]
MVDPAHASARTRILRQVNLCASEVGAQTAAAGIEQAGCLCGAGSVRRVECRAAAIWQVARAWSRGPASPTNRRRYRAADSCEAWVQSPGLRKGSAMTEGSRAIRARSPGRRDSLRRVRTDQRRAGLGRTCALTSATVLSLAREACLCVDVSDVRSA